MTKTKRSEDPEINLVKETAGERSTRETLGNKRPFVAHYTLSPTPTPTWGWEFNKLSGDEMAGYGDGGIVVRTNEADFDADIRQVDAWIAATDRKEEARLAEGAAEHEEEIAQL